MIGIIGGNGVAATNKLLQLIEEKITKNGAFRDCHHPKMIAWQATRAPSRSMYLEGRGESFLDDYIRIGKHLKDCDVILCVCVAIQLIILLMNWKQRLGSNSLIFWMS